MVTTILRLIFRMFLGIITLSLAYNWFMHLDGLQEAGLALIAAILFFVELMFDGLDNIFGGKERPRIEFELVGNGTSKGPSNSRERKEVKIGWRYNGIIRNQSNYAAFKPKIILKNEIEGISFPGMNKIKPDALYIFKESYAMPIDNLNEKESIQPGGRNLIRIYYDKKILATTNEANNLLRNGTPSEIENIEFLLQYENGEGRNYYTSIYRKGGKWETKTFSYKPIKYW